MTTFFARKIWKAFLANGVLQMGNKFGKKCPNLTLKFGVLFGCVILKQFFCEPAIFHLAKKVFP